MHQTSFPQRFGTPKGTPIDKDFPSSARIALCYILLDLNTKQYLVKEESVLIEINRLGRLTIKDIENTDRKEFIYELMIRIGKLTWDQVYTFCERAYQKLLIEYGDGFNNQYVSIDEVRNYYSSEINQLLDEENLAYHFEDGVFQRRGRAQTQKALEKTGAVLSDPSLEKVKLLFNKARRYYDARPEPDLENCVKESLCALEAAIEIITGKSASKDFEKAVKQLEGNGNNQIPTPIAQTMIKIYSYRGSGQGVAHAALQGNRVAPEDAELVLSLTADFITYLANLYPREPEIPF
ncbi:MAG: hypothetical protein P4L50_28645 [Anaerolineaceae bacterium]|nr:hypothetical protein [Anaerolineaceae bacterium]